jgi:hypothetical protein
MSRIHELSERPRQDGDLAAVLDAAYDAFEDMLTCIRAVEDPDDQIGRRGKSHQPHGRVRRPGLSAGHGRRMIVWTLGSVAE